MKYESNKFMFTWRPQRIKSRGQFFKTCFTRNKTTNIVDSSLTSKTLIKEGRVFRVKLWKNKWTNQTRWNKNVLQVAGVNSAATHIILSRRSYDKINILKCPGSFKLTLACGSFPLWPDIGFSTSIKTVRTLFQLENNKHLNQSLYQAHNGLELVCQSDSQWIQSVSQLYISQTVINLKLSQSSSFSVSYSVKESISQAVRWPVLLSVSKLSVRQSDNQSVGPSVSQSDSHQSFTRSIRGSISSSASLLVNQSVNPFDS